MCFLQQNKCCIWLATGGVNPIVLPNLQSVCKDKFKASCDIRSIDFFKKIDLKFTDLYPSNKQTLGELLVGFFNYYNDFE